MYHYDYKTEFTCSQAISLDLDGDKVKNVSFKGGCDGNLKAISKLVDGMSEDEIERVLSGNTCGKKPTSCADQLAKAARAALESSRAGA